jgi:hypothetical protein
MLRFIEVLAISVEEHRNSQGKKARSFFGSSIAEGIVATLAKGWDG